jgi:hypothetical protein
MSLHQFSPEHAPDIRRQSAQHWNLQRTRPVLQATLQSPCWQVALPLAVGAWQGVQLAPQVSVEVLLTQAFEQTW